MTFWVSSSWSQIRLSLVVLYTTMHFLTQCINLWRGKLTQAVLQHQVLLLVSVGDEKPEENIVSAWSLRRFFNILIYFIVLLWNIQQLLILCRQWHKYILHCIAKLPLHLSGNEWTSFCLCFFTCNMHYAMFFNIVVCVCWAIIQRKLFGIVRKDYSVSVKICSRGGSVR